MKITHKKNGVPGAVWFALVTIAVLGGIYFLAAASRSSGPASDIQALVGKPAPQFSLQDRNGTTYSNESLKGKDAVLFFNEGIMCYPACWNQMAALAQDSRLNNSSTIALSIVIDQPSEWQSVVQKMPALGSATVLFDTDRIASNEYGMLTVNSSMHYGSYPGHTFVLIDKQGIVRWVYDDPTMGIDDDRITAALQQLNGQ